MRRSQSDDRPPSPDRDSVRFHGATRAGDASRLTQSVSDVRFSTGLYCVRCGGRRVVGWGRYRDRARFRCRECGRTFNALTNTPFAYSKRLDRWLEYLFLMRAQTTLRRAAIRLDLHLSTSFRWRHRVLASTLLGEEALSGQVELLEALFPFSEKGSRGLARPAHTRGGYADKTEWMTRRRVRLMLLCARNGRAAASLVVSNVPVTSLIAEALTGLLVPPAVLLTSSTRMSAYGAAVLRCGHHLRTVPRSMPLDSEVELVHTKNVRAFERRLRRWLLPFRGVATKYLLRYLVWHRFSDRDDAVGWQNACITWIAAAAPASFAHNFCEQSVGGRRRQPFR